MPRFSIPKQDKKIHDPINPIKSIHEGASSSHLFSISKSCHSQPEFQSTTSAAVQTQEEVMDTDTATQTQTHRSISMPEQAHTPQRSELKEQFDEDGDVLTVGNLTFVEGILGTGAYGTVRLAHQRPWMCTPPSTNLSTPAGSSKKRIRDTHTHGLARSVSEPSDGAFFRRAQHLEKSQTSLVGELFASPFKKEKNNDLVAVKIFNKSILKRMRTMERDKATNKVQVKTAYEKVEREIALMKKFSHPNLVALYDVIDSPESDNLYMVLEYMPLGEILTYQNDGTFRRTTKTGHRPMEGVVDGHFDEAHAALYFVDILHALAYLHQHHICHRDLKPENILLDARGIVKISDFGVSHFFEEDQDIGAQRLAHAQQHHPTKLTRTDTDSALQMTGMADTGLLTKTEGTWCFWSPAMCSSSSNTFSGYAADIWAAGVCLYIFVTGKLPFFSEVPTELFDLIAQADVPYEGLGLSDSLLDLLKVTLEKDSTKRAGVGQCLKHPFLQVARMKRIQQLSAEFRESSSRTLFVGEDDVLRAFRVVTTMVNPAVLFKNAQKQIKEGFQAARERLSMGGSTFSSSSSLADYDPTTPVTRGKKTLPIRNGMQMLYQRGSLSSFGSSASESDEHVGGTSSGKLFPIPQNRVMTESSRNISGYSDGGSPILNSSRTQDGEFDLNEEPRSVSQSPSEKQASDVSAQAVAVEQKKRTKLRRNESREACIIQ